ncbi:hypothetical protein H072_8885 [Dactylellina haptotyla CBS 200.50]|uniref:Uncharacterized protein n=1 Tax=Dactylellina haptotyla (strain CBS 200.50) TaxID=1284197 RepID=S8A3U7_DACHA|nr:hypothetical protein H072_8885 [Dactylellina haptotyla CBS 200.50]
MDPETASIHSNAPSYVSQVPSYRASDLPPYSSDGRLPPYSRLYSSLIAGAPACGSSEAHELALPRLKASLGSVSGLPPVALISPGASNSQARQYEAVAARRRARIVSAISSDLFAPQPPRPPPRRRKRTTSLPFENFSSLHPAPSSPGARVHSTSELFLCTCGRPNHRKTGESWRDSEYPRQISTRSLLFDEPSNGPGPLIGTSTAMTSNSIGCGEMALNTSAAVDNEGQGDPHKENDTEDDLLDAESKSWDFMLSQMTG